ncbi:hypothetical protein L3Q82_002088 [Scortum barcoo]|uniref:Uncharacterized protein n=1 Tax=Scortum barcoo TaxID=214431 RepID=A0ACB8W4M5_9TELE|nr:hypothetical protein L3Q82_002088 [Scortum barcoo]
MDTSGRNEFPPCRVAGRSLRDRGEKLGQSFGRSSRVEPLLLRIERSQLRWLGHLFRMPPGRLPREVFRQACPTGRRPRGRPRTRWRDYVSRLAWERLGVPPEELEEVSGVSTVGLSEVVYQKQLPAVAKNNTREIKVNQKSEVVSRRTKQRA